MIDENFKVWMIEMNTNPCLELSCPLLGRIIPTMLENAFRIAIDPIFPPPAWPHSKRHTIPDNFLDNNKFELIFDEEESGPYLRTILNTSNQPNRTAFLPSTISWQFSFELVDQIYEIEEENEDATSDCGEPDLEWSTSSHLLSLYFFPWIIHFFLIVCSI